MSGDLLDSARQYVEKIKKSGKDIYASTGDCEESLRIPLPELEALLNAKLSGLGVGTLSLRERLKLIKASACEAMGYPIPPSFQKTKPRFPGQNVEIYQGTNLQFHGEVIDEARRYVILQILGDGTVGRIRVLSGDMLSLFRPEPLRIVTDQGDPARKFVINLGPDFFA